MLKVTEENARLLLGGISRGEVVLFLGAGASATCISRQGTPVLQGKALARRIAELSGLSYANEELSEVLSGVLGRRMSVDQFHRLLREQYTGVQPSAELIAALGYSWKRLYSWNIDDALVNLPGGVQRRRYYNGLIDKVSEYEGLDYLHVVQLHGEAAKPEHGFIFSSAEYNDRLNRDTHDWYRLAASDYASFIPLFIGSRLNEPILAAELDRARPHPNAGLGMAFLVTPDQFTEVQLAGFEARNIVVLQATLEQFVGWLQSKLAKKLTPLDVARQTNAFADKMASRLVASDVAIAQSIIRHDWSTTSREIAQLGAEAKSRAGRAFLEGAPPTWRLAASDIPVWLTHTDALYKSICVAVSERQRSFVVYGQSGSGKTTALMQCLLRYVRENEGVPLYELRPDVASLRDALNLIHRLHPDDEVLVYVGDAFSFGDALAEDILSFPKGAMTLFSSTRTAQWKTHIQRRIGESSSSFEFQRFVEPDYDPLISRLLEYVPAPLFKKMGEDQRRQQLTQSKSQLLIALKEATTSDTFTNVITKEYVDLPDDDCRLLVLLVAFPTIARTGVAPGAVREAYSHLRTKRSFESALASLEGIVSARSDGRLTARHELYVRHIVDNVASTAVAIDALVALLRTFTKYRPPIVKTVERQDGNLFKFLLNHNFVLGLAKHRGDVDRWLRVYSSFEIDFQLDGHFWLQYGQYLQSTEQYEQALDVLEKSIHAYPDNTFAVHAYANVQLHVAERRREYDATTIELIADAARALEELNARTTKETDQYPIVTLSVRHLQALLKHKQDQLAKRLAPKYFRQLEELMKWSPSEQVQLARERLAFFVSTGRWHYGHYTGSKTTRNRAGTRKRPRDRRR
jgi:hypothetical protein